jgi:hypothetical protein
MTTKQEQFEYDSHLEAIQKRRQILQRAKEKTYYSSTDEGQHLFRSLLATCAGLANEQLELLGGEPLAFIALKKIIDCIDTGINSLTDVASVIGRSIESEARINFYLAQAGEDTAGLIKAKLKKKNSTPRYKNYGIKKSVENQLLEKGWSKDEFFPNWATPGLGPYDRWSVVLAMGGCSGAKGPVCPPVCRQAQSSIGVRHLTG